MSTLACWTQSHLSPRIVSIPHLAQHKTCRGATVPCLRISHLALTSASRQPLLFMTAICSLQHCVTDCVLATPLIGIYSHYPKNDIALLVFDECHAASCNAGNMLRCTKSRCNTGRKQTCRKGSQLMSCRSFYGGITALLNVFALCNF